MERRLIDCLVGRGLIDGLAGRGMFEELNPLPEKINKIIDKSIV